MNFGLTDEQMMLREAAADALSRLATLESARAALDGTPLLDLWPTAREAGWAGLLIDEGHGGAGLGAFDAMLVFEECGRRLAGAGLLGHLTATHVLTAAAREGDAAAEAQLGPLAEGTRRAAMVNARPPAASEGWTVDGHGIGARRTAAPRLAEGKVTGAAGHQPDVAGADVLVVAAIDHGNEPCAVLVDPQAQGVTVEAVTAYDASRPLAHMILEGAPAQVLGASADALAGAWYLAQSLLAADSLGVAQTMLDMAVAYAKDRQTFGRPIGSYQAIKQQIVEIMRHAETTRSLTFYTGFAAEQRPQELALAASCARFAGEEAADYATRTCIAVHGGTGATWEHDAPLYWRRAQLSRLLLGGIADAGDRVAEEIIARARESAQATATT